MKKLLYTAIIIIGTTAAAFAAAYSSSYSKNLQTCNPYVEKFKIQVPADNPDNSAINLHSTETIVGWRDGKCITTSLVFSDDLNQNILETKCAFSENQIASIVKKTEAAGKGDEKAAKNLQDELTGYANDGTTCMVKNLIKEY